jgi:hypothetical protein
MGALVTSVISKTNSPLLPVSDSGKLFAQASIANDSIERAGSGESAISFTGRLD